MKYNYKKKLIGTSDRYRLHIFRSNFHIYIQVIDDTNGFTLCNASTLKLKGGRNSTNAIKIGANIAENLLKMKIKKIYFDRGKYPYKGLIKLVCDSARESGLEF